MGFYSADLKIMRVYPAGREATSYTVLNGTEILAPYAFQGADKLTEIKLPDTLQSVYPMAFLDCKALTSLTLPVGVTSVEDGFVRGCDSLEQIFFLGDAPEFSE